MQVSVLGIWGEEASNPSLTAGLCETKEIKGEKIPLGSLSQRGPDPKLIHYITDSKL